MKTASSSALPLFHVVGFAGHRHLAAPAAVAGTLREALAGLRRDFSGEWVALSSAAVGGDTLFAREALAAGLPWHASLPLPAADFRADFAPEQWAEAEALLARAAETRVVNDGAARPDAYLENGMELVNECDVLLALWDGQPAQGRGGTGEIVEYARRVHKPLVLVDAHTLAARRENFDRFTERDPRLEELNALAVPGEGDEAGAAAPADPALDLVRRFHRTTDLAAARGAPQFRRLVSGTVLLHVLATVVAAAGVSFGWHFGGLPWLELACLLGGFGVALALRAAGMHHRWLHCRLAAELARSAMATWGLPRAAALFEDLDVAEYRYVTRALSLLHRRSAAAAPVTPADFRRRYAAERIDHQIGYFRAELAVALPWLHGFRYGFWIASILAIVCTTAYALHVGEDWAPGHETAHHFLPIVLPVVAAALLSLVSIHDLERRVARYREMEHRLVEARDQIEFCQTWNCLERLVRRTERALLQEVIEWHSIARHLEAH